jgi:hypothetical protein
VPSAGHEILSKRAVGELPVQIVNCFEAFLKTLTQEG